MSDLVIRDLAGHREFLAAETLQRAVWGEGDMPDPADLMMVIAHEGGAVIGAFRGETLLGYLFGFPTSDPQVQHSHRLAVLPEARGLGLGVRLKWAQRDWCLARGIRLVRWTYDPLRHVNAALNIGRLGATARIYHENYYGEMAGINAGAPSDRVLAEWRLDAPEVAARAEKRHRPRETAMRFALPADFGAMLSDDPAAALAARLESRAFFTARFADGWALGDYDPQTREYLLYRDLAPPFRPAPLKSAPAS